MQTSACMVRTQCMWLRTSHHLPVQSQSYMWCVVQTAAAMALMLALHLRHPLRIPGQDDISRLEEFAGPVGRVQQHCLACSAGSVQHDGWLAPYICKHCMPSMQNCACMVWGLSARAAGGPGLLSLRTAAITGVFALATAMAAQSDVAHAAGHQICLQLWLASSLLADALAVAAQTLVARLLASSQSDAAQASLVHHCSLSSSLLPQSPCCHIVLPLQAAAVAAATFGQVVVMPGSYGPGEYCAGRFYF